jgi:hypothetical protein
LLNKPCSNNVVEVAKARVQDFGSKSQNPITTSVEETTKEIEGLESLGENSESVITNKKLLGQDSNHINTTTNKAKNFEFQKKINDVINDVEQILSKAQIVTTLILDL